MTIGFKTGPRTRRPKKPPGDRSPGTREEEKRPRTAFSGPQLARLKVKMSNYCFILISQYFKCVLLVNSARIRRK